MKNTVPPSIALPAFAAVQIGLVLTAEPALRRLASHCFWRQTPATSTTWS
ncbi:hypothetical protein A6P39_041550 [Streptomyces sp. FXJ1.172]|nr:hypothetical protein [Streptomyces sp. FXJ1.172]WEO99990.1 hypothetical protein A6P39_041550 [Streptomyces sp. FXJ1.172]